LPGAEGIRKYWSDMSKSFPDFRFDVDVLEATEDFVTLAYRMSGSIRVNIWGTSRLASVSLSDAFRWVG
jgi:hypothetical protein